MVRTLLTLTLAGLGWHAPAQAAAACQSILPAERAAAPAAHSVVTTKVPPSALFTLSALDVREARAVDDRTVWLLSSQDQRLVPFARIQAAARSNAHQVEWYPPTAQSPASTARLQLGAMEHLYALLLKQDPQHRFLLSAGKKKGKPAWLSHAHALAEVASMRGCAAARLQSLEPGLQITPWSMPAMEPQPSRGAHGLEVSARVRDASGQPISGHLSFLRGGHLACSAPVQPSGVGRCTLFDEHGHDLHDLHDHEHHARTVVLFSGSIGTQRIVLPTTQVYGAGGRH